MRCDAMPQVYNNVFANSRKYHLFTCESTVTGVTIACRRFYWCDADADADTLIGVEVNSMVFDLLHLF